jgi:hypothetical protein
MTAADTQVVIPGLVAAMVGAPLVAAAALQAGLARLAPRLPAATALAIAFVAGNLIAWRWTIGDGVACELGDRLGGGGAGDRVRRRQSDRLAVDDRRRRGL